MKLKHRQIVAGIICLGLMSWPIWIASVSMVANPVEVMAASASTGTASYRVPQTLTAIAIDEGPGTTFTLVSGIAGTRIQLWDVFLTSNLTGSTATIVILSGSTPLTGAMSTNAFTWDAPIGQSGVHYAFPKFVTNAGDDLKVTLGASGTLTGQIKYTQLP